MQTKAVRLHGKNDLRLDTFTLREIRDDEILGTVISDSACMSTYKGVILGSGHKRIPGDIATNPIVTGHEFAGVIEQVGEKLKDKYRPGQKFTLQPNINHKGLGYAPGYSFPDFGGNATRIIIPAEVMRKGFFLEYSGDAYFKASLAEPLSCIIAALKAAYHTDKGGKAHSMGVKKNGNFALLAGCGAMGLGTIDLLLHMQPRPAMILATDIDQARIDTAKKVLPPEAAAKQGVALHYVNTYGMENAAEHLRAFTGGNGFDDVMVMAPVESVIAQADAIAGKDGCINFFSGPTDIGFSAPVNFYDVHYNAKHIIGTSGGDTADMIESLRIIEGTDLNPAVMVTHIGGLDSVPELLINLPKLPGGKKLTYSNISLELTAIGDFEQKGKNDPLFAGLHEICKKHSMLWNAEAEQYLLENAKSI
jgi:threonine dehydrogenase-like Zn-dependent dehydrogenase